MANYKLSNLAAKDLIRIYEYGILNHGLTRAREYLLALHRTFQKLADNPELGRGAEQLKKARS